MLQTIGSWLFMLFLGLGVLYVGGTFVWMSGNPADWGVGPRAAITLAAFAYMIAISVMAVKNAQ